MFKCLDCGNEKFHVTFYHCFRMPEGIPEIMENETEIRCVVCHKTYLLSEVKNGQSVNSNGHQTEANVGGGETPSIPAAKKTRP